MIIYDLLSILPFMRTTPRGKKKEKKKKDPTLLSPPGGSAKTLAGRDGLEGFQGHWPLAWIAYAEILD